MMTLTRGTVIQVNLDPTGGPETGKTRPCVVVTNNVFNERLSVIQVVPITTWNEKKGRIKTNIDLVPSPTNGLSKRSLADCLQTRPVDHTHRMVAVLGELTAQEMRRIDEGLKTVFALK